MNPRFLLVMEHSWLRPPPLGLWSFLWFVGFCFLTNQWQRTAPGPGTTQAGDAARAAITFSFFSILSWVSVGPGRSGG